MSMESNIILYGLVVLILLSQGGWLFINAKKRGRSAWFWGLIGLVQFPWPSIFYWFFVIRPLRKRNR
jgi:hypothetical protein